MLTRVAAIALLIVGATQPAAAVAIFDGSASIVVTVQSITGAGSLNELNIEGETFADFDILLETGTATGGSTEASGGIGPITLGVGDSIEVSTAGTGSVPGPIGSVTAFVAAFGNLIIENSSVSEFIIELAIVASAVASSSITDAATEDANVGATAFLSTSDGTLFEGFVEADAFVGLGAPSPFTFDDLLAITVSADDEETVELGVSVLGLAESNASGIKAPEPGTLALLSLGVVMLSTRARRAISI